MTMSKKIIALAIIISILLIIYAAYTNRKKIRNNNQILITISLLDLKKERSLTEKTAQRYFQDSALNIFTLKYIEIINDKFKNITKPDELLVAVHTYLLSQHSENVADKLFRIYSQHHYYLISVNNFKRKSVKQSGSLEFLNKLQNNRRKFFGYHTADILFAIHLKKQRYEILENEIVSNSTVSGNEKVIKLKNLGERFWNYKNFSFFDIKGKPKKMLIEKIFIYEFRNHKDIEKQKRISEEIQKISSEK